MKSIHVTVALCAALALAACSDGGPNDNTQAAAPELAMYMLAEESGGGEIDAFNAETERARQQSAGDDGEALDPALQQYIAYTYDFHLRFGAAAVEPAMEAHREACMAAGADVCQVVNSSSFSRNETHAQARLQIRAAPGWLDGFLADLDGDVEESGGEIVSSNMSSTDLSRPILDAEARLNAQRALRDRLTALLGREDADLADLVALERELARVQGGIESIESNLRNLRARVTMSTVDLAYSSRVTVTGDGAVNPVTAALRDVVRNFSRALGAVITFVAMAAPWLILIIPALWLLARWRRRVNARKRAEKAAG